MWSTVGVLIALAGCLIGVVKYLRRAASTEATLGERDAELNLERQRVRQMESADTEARKSRREKLREKAATADPDQLLRDVTGADDPNVN